MTNTHEMFTALGNPTRRLLFERLRTRSCTVGELARGLPMTRPAVSQHLKVLKSAGLVRSRAEGTRRIYQIDPLGVAAMRGYLNQFWEQSLDNLKAIAEEETL